MDLTAQSFMSACRDGGQLLEAWLRVVEREYGAGMRREAASVLSAWPLAEEAVQEGMLKVWQRCSLFNGTGHPLAWIRTTVRNTVLDVLRKQNPEEPLEDDEGGMSPAVQTAINQLSIDAVATPEQILHERQVEAVFRRGFDQFSIAYPVRATVLRWVVEDGLNDGDVAELLDRTPGATRQFISQSRKKLQPYLAEWYSLVSAAPGDPHEDEQ
jgi:RNA polymerase sigma factor (sigma-70 family)